MPPSLSKVLDKQRAKSRDLPQRSEPLWAGPDVDGITFSLLSRWLVCRHRFWLYAVQGLTAADEFNTAIEFGQMWHDCEEAHCRGNDWLKAATARYQRWRRDYPTKDAETRKWYNVLKTTFPIYIEYWKKNDLEVRRKPLFEEKEFKLPYTLPSGRTLFMRGKIDGGFSSDESVIIQENKTKTSIDTDGINATIQANLQTMFYQLAARLALKEEKGHHQYFDFGLGIIRLPSKRDNVKLKVNGLLFNVIKRPLGDLHAIKQKKGRLVKGKRVGVESETQFYERLGKVIKAGSSDYFQRWLVTLEDDDMTTFCNHVLNPILEQLMDWWEWIKQDPMDPFAPRYDPYHTDGNDNYRVIPNNQHWQSPWGVYNSLGLGFRGDYFDYLTAGRTGGLKQATTLFPELNHQ